MIPCVHVEGGGPVGMGQGYSWQPEEAREGRQGSPSGGASELGDTLSHRGRRC